MPPPWKKIYNQQNPSASDRQLSELEAEFRRAYILKGLEAQLSEKQADKLARDVAEKLSQQLITVEDEKVKEECIKKAHDALQTQKTYKNLLLQEIARKKEVKHIEEVAAQKERQLLVDMDELMDKLHEQTKLQRRNHRAERSRRERLLFEEMRQLRRAMEMKEEVLQAQREVLYLDLVEQRAQEFLNLALEREKRRENMLEQVTQLFINTTLEKHQREVAIEELMVQDVWQEAQVEVREEEARKARAQLAEELLDQIKFAAECEARARERDQAFGRGVRARVEVQECFQMLTDAARKRKQRQLREDLEKLIQERKEMREEALRHARAKLIEMRLKDETEKGRVKAWRRRLIEQHAGNVAAYLKQGILSKEEEKLVEKLLTKCKES